MAAIEPQLPPNLVSSPDDRDLREGGLDGHSTRGPWQKFVSYIWDG